MRFLVINENLVVGGNYGTIEEAKAKVRELALNNPWETWRVLQATTRQLDTMAYLATLR